jgi:uncharacterized protein YjeT (DUF2065 family)
VLSGDRLAPGGLPTAAGEAQLDGGGAKGLALVLEGLAKALVQHLVARLLRDLREASEQTLEALEEGLKLVGPDGVLDIGPHLW